MNQARVNLNGLMGLLHKCEDSVLAMLETVDTIDVPDAWESVDIVKQTVSLMVGLTTTSFNRAFRDTCSLSIYLSLPI